MCIHHQQVMVTIDIQGGRNPSNGNKLICSEIMTTGNTIDFGDLSKSQDMDEYYLECQMVMEV